MTKVTDSDIKIRQASAELETLQAMLDVVTRHVCSFNPDLDDPRRIARSLLSELQPFLKYPLHLGKNKTEE